MYDHFAGDGTAVLDSLAGVAVRNGAPGVAERTEEVRAAIDEALSAVEFDLKGDDAARDAACYMLKAPGKRLRPLCVALGASLAGREFDGAVRNLAVAAELVHAATLLHDDVIDLGTERRGAPAARMVYGNAASVLGGDHLLVQALKRVRLTRCTRALGELIDVIDAMVGAEALQLDRRGRFEPDRSVYLRVARGKTAGLFVWSLRAGAMLERAPSRLLRRLTVIGECLGLAFQLVDDALDLDGDPAVTGKSPLVDVREGKLTWPLLLAAEADPAVCVALHRLSAENAAPRPDDAALIVQQVRNTGALAATRDAAYALADRAGSEIQRLPPGAARDVLGMVVDSAVRRAR